MSDPIILLDDDDDPITPFAKKPRTVSGPGPDPVPTILVLDDDPTPQKSTSVPSFVAETPLSDLSIVKCTTVSSKPSIRVSNPSGLILLESENDDSEGGSGWHKWKGENSWNAGDDDDAEEDNVLRPGFMDSLGDDDLTQLSWDCSSQPTFAQDNVYQVQEYPNKENVSIEQMGNITKHRRTRENSDHISTVNEPVKKKMTKEERACIMEERKEEKARIMEERKRKKEEEKLQKGTLKTQAAESKKLEKEKKKWEKGKFALKSIVAEFDAKVVEQGSVGGHLLTRFADKGIAYRIASNPIEKSIVWSMSLPKHISELSPGRIEVQYVLVVFEAEEFCKIVENGSLLDHVSRVQRCYPAYTICYLTNRLMAYINKREKEQYKNPQNDASWRRPPIEEVLAKLTTHFARIHYRQCTDEAELAEHVVGLTRSLASCQFRTKLTRLSVNANGSLVPKDCIDRNLIKKSPWLKALVAIPKVQPRFAIAIWKRYPTMKSLLSVYMDPSKSVHEKEFLLQDLTTEGLLGGDRRVGQICSKRVYRILMAQNGSIKTDNVEDGADFFTHLEYTCLL